MLRGEVAVEDVREAMSNITNVEDYVAQVGQGAIADRTAEHLGRSDILVTLLRNIFTREMRNVAEDGRSSAGLAPPMATSKAASWPRARSSCSEYDRSRPPESGGAVDSHPLAGWAFRHWNLDLGRRAFPRWCFVYAPGAGSKLDDGFGVFAAQHLAGCGIPTLRFQFPYMEEGRRLPDRAPALEATWCARDRGHSPGRPVARHWRSLDGWAHRVAGGRRGGSSRLSPSSPIRCTSQVTPTATGCPSPADRHPHPLLLLRHPRCFRNPGGAGSGGGAVTARDLAPYGSRRS